MTLLICSMKLLVSGMVQGMENLPVTVTGKWVEFVDWRY